MEFLLEQGEAPGIVYCSTVRQVEETAAMLQGLGIRAAAYHGQMDAARRRQNQEDFLFDRVQVMVATNAFGMGIDKPNVRFVVHYNMPKDLESYYQEAGRAGRDGEEARCVLLYAPNDVRLAHFFIDKEEAEGDAPSEKRAAAAQEARERLKYMTFYATTRRCLRAELLHYFGEACPSRCRSCSNCLAPKVALPRPRPAAPAPRRAAAPAAGVDEKLLDALYAVRRDLARREKLPAFMIFPDAVLRDHLPAPPPHHRRPAGHQRHRRGEGRPLRPGLSGGRPQGRVKHSFSQKIYKRTQRPGTGAFFAAPLRRFAVSQRFALGWRGERKAKYKKA